MAYSNEEREKVLSEASKKENEFRGMNIAFAYHMYDIMRLQLEELHRLANAVESIEISLRQVKQSQ